MSLRNLALALTAMMLVSCGGTAEDVFRPDFDNTRSEDSGGGFFSSLFGGSSGDSGPVPAGCYAGTLTDEGITCQALRAGSGRLITFTAPMRGFVNGDSVCVCGTPSRDPYCKQGASIVVSSIETECVRK